MFVRPSRAHRLLLAACLAVGALSFATPAAAHADLVTATPAPNGSVADSPTELRLTFSEAIDAEAVSIELLDTQQRAITGLGEPETEADGLSVRVALPEIGTGVFTVSYQVVSRVDGHATAGLFAFLVDPTGAAPPPADTAVEVSPSVDGYTIAARWLGLIGMLVAMGSLVLWAASGRVELARRRVPVGPPCTLVAAGAALGASGIVGYLLLAARPLDDPGTGLPLDPAAAFGWTPFAIAMRISIVAAILAAATAWVVRRREGRRLALVIGALLAVALGGMSVAGHAASIGGPLGAILDLAHLLGVAAWLGALPAAGVLARRATGERRDMLVALLRRHGSTALVAAPVVVLSGIANSPLVLGRGRDLVASDYGNLLVAKALLVGIALGIGAVNHLALRGRGRAALGTLVGAELAVAVVAVAVAATMVTIQPASARRPVLNAPPVMPAHFSEVVGPVRAHLAVSLPAPGRQAYRVTLRRTDSEAAPPDVQKVFLTFDPPTGTDLPSQRVELEEDERGGLWLAAGTYTPIVGEWTLDLTIRRRGAQDESVAVPLTVLDPGAAQLGPPPDTGVGVPALLAATWSLTPPGAAGWLPPLAALAILLAAWWQPSSAVRDAARGIGTAILVVTVLAAGSRDLVAAANAPRSDELAEQGPLPSADPQRGRSIYLANCASCHGVDLDGRGPVDTIPPAGHLADAVRSASDAMLSYRISYGVAGTAMPAFAGSLTAEERSDLIGYLRQQAARP